MKLTRIFLAFLLALAILAGAVAMLVHGNDARAAPVLTYCDGCRSEFGYGVATHGSGTITRFGNTDINNSGEDALDLGTLSSSAETWVVGELNDHADIQYLMSSWLFYDPYDVQNGPYNGRKTEWRWELSTTKGEPSPGTFIVTHVALQKIDSNGNTVLDSACAGDMDGGSASDTGWCIFGLSDNSVKYWGQDGYLDDWASLPSPTKTLLTNWSFDDHFDDDQDGRLGEIEITTTNFITMYPWLGTNQTVHDIRPVAEGYNDSNGDHYGQEFIVGGVIYDPTDATYTDGKFDYFVENNDDVVYVIFNMPNALRWIDSDPILDVSYDALFYEYQTFISDTNNTATTTVALAPSGWTHNEDWPEDMVADATGAGGKYSGGKFPLAAWGLTAYLAGSGDCAEASTILSKTKETITATVKMISDVTSSNVDSMDRWVMEVSVLGGADIVTDREKWLVHSLGDWMYTNRDDWVFKQFFFQPAFLQPSNQPYWEGNVYMPFICNSSNCYTTKISDGWKDAAAGTSVGSCP